MVVGTSVPPCLGVTKALVVGADLSSKHLAFVAKHPLTPTAAVVKYPVSATKDGYRPENCAEALACMYEFCETLGKMSAPGVELVAWVEAPAIGRGGAQTTMKQSFVSGVVQAVLVQAGFAVHLVQNTTWKREVCGRGDASKTDVGRSLGSRWPSIARACGGDQDLIDAACIALYGQAIVVRRGRLA